MEATRTTRLGAISWLAAAALMCVACSGGTEGPDVSGPGPGPGELPQPGFVPGGGSSTSTSSCTTCADVLAGDIPQSAEELCPGVESLFTEVISCLCMGACSESCTSFCQSFQLDSTCSSCGSQFCSAELSACQNG